MEYWESTQRMLQGEPPLVKRPKLTETLLKKPPFRFLHDVISELCRQTGFARGLFTEDELISTNIKEKEKKVAYLWKIVDCIGITLNTNVPVRPLKIVAGLEPEQTNVFLQMLAAATMVDKQHGERAVARVLAGEKQPPSSHNGVEWIQLLSKAMSSQDVSQASEQLPQLMEEEPQATQTRDKQFPSTNRPPDGSTKMGFTVLDLAPTHQVPKMSNSYLKSGSIASSDQVQLDEQSTKVNSERDASPLEPDFLMLSPTITHKTNSKDTTPRKSLNDRPTLAPGSGSKHETPTKVIGVIDNTQPSLHAASSILEDARSGNAAPFCNEAKGITSMDCSMAPIPRCGTPHLGTPAMFPSVSSLSGQRPQSARPQSARKAPPVLRNVLDKGGAKNLQGTLLERPATARVYDIEELVRKPNILLDIETDDDKQENMPVLLPPPNMQETIVLASMEGAGKLVCDILQNKADLPEQDEYGENNNDVEEIGIILGQMRATSVKKGDVQSRKKEIQKLREVIQSLCQTANPLGKSIDHLQEDSDIMNKEYQLWIKERDTYTIKLEEEKRITEEWLQEESGRVLELDEEIRQQNQCINSLKAQILRNDETIKKLLRKVTSKNTKYSS